MGARGRIGRVWKVGLLLAVGGAGGGAAIAVASIPDGNGVIHACYQVASPGSTVPANTIGNVRIIDPSAGQHCNTVNSPAGAPANELTLNWNQSGPQGPTGAQGAPGRSVTITAGTPAGVTITLPPPGRRSTPVASATLNGSGKPIVFEILSFSWGVSNPTTAAGGGGSREGTVPSVHEIVVTKVYDKLSPLLALAVINGKLFKSAVILVPKKTGTPYLRITLKDVLISSYQLGGHGPGGRPTETLTLNFTGVSISYTQYSK